MSTKVKDIIIGKVTTFKKSIRNSKRPKFWLCAASIHLGDIIVKKVKTFPRVRP